MAEVYRSALVLHTAEQMFDLINDVRRYPEFVPWCSKTELLAETQEMIEAKLYVSKAGLSYSFTTRNRKQRPLLMDMELVEGPFSEFSAGWTITPLNEEACKVEFVMKFNFSGKLANLAMNKVFNSVATTMVDIFVERADKLYG
ncbi:type II toxin-antitoxin system RatA family toxin [Nitrincola tapanii]|uniref:Type II toxin-antitoxin system RatA family toxin n=1 Tax=Nitrincola tapanii TaxID=1708751 RepID=A0A5A9W6Y1_9GAMM|nr:type II toxin-antitoxin system RatA family toxin [Nitrincola tapanii]KAA0876476.1 type II toxin-antitoxin system RatA family toxin [Nitrincola tapanii]